MQAPPLSHEHVKIPDDAIILPSLELLSDSPEYIVDASRVSVYVDPLDGTKSYAKGDYDAVTILVAIILDNLPYFGVITKPFGYKSYSTILETNCFSVYGGALLKGVYLAGGMKCEVNALGDDLPRAVISSSRSEGIVRDFVDHLAAHHVIHPDPILVSGAGEKSLRLVLGNEKETLWFFPKAGTSRWDVAASDALLRALGGVVTDKYGQELDYSKSREDAENVDGIIASNSSTLHAECIRLFEEGDWKSR
jgi:3'(2'), 5'-bisphosphate nucleotidase